MCAATSAMAGSGKIRKYPDHVPDQYVVTFADSPESPHVLAGELAHLHGAKVFAVYTVSIKGMAFVGNERAAEAISRDPRVETVEQDSIGYVTQVPPTDPPAGPGWAKDRMDRKPLPLNGTYAPGSSNKGYGAAIYVVDTGIDQLTGTYASEFEYTVGGVPVNRLRNLFTYAFTNGVPNYSDHNGHGTPVATAAAGKTRGVAAGAEIVNVKACNEQGICTSSRVLSGLEAIKTDFLTQNPVGDGYRKPAIVNFSIATKMIGVGVDQGYPAVENSIRDMIRTGIAFCVGAGNDGLDPRFYSPARLGQPNTHLDAIAGNDSDNPFPEHVTTVGATSLLPPNYDQDYVMADGGNVSNIGPSIDVWAPGYQVHVISKQSMLVTISGTSFAAPFVSGALARYAVGNFGTLPSAAVVASWENALIGGAAQGVIWNRANASTNLNGGPNRLLFVF